MMLIGLIRPVETPTIDVQSKDVPGLKAELAAAAPDGWELISIPQRTIGRRDGIREIEATNIASMRTAVPEGWQLLSVRPS